MRTFSTLFAMALAATAAHALPDVVKPVQLGVECHNYPGFSAATGEAGPWPLYASSTDGQVARGAGSTVSDVDAGVQAKFQVRPPGPYAATQGIFLFRPLASYSHVPANQPLFSIQIGVAVNPAQAKLILKCASSSLLAYYNASWTAVTRGPDDKAFLLVGQEGGTELQAHAHFLADGSQQEGVFLGSGGHTTWAYKRRTGSGGLDEFRIRLLVGSDSLEEGEFKGFVRVGAF